MTVKSDNIQFPVIKGHNFDQIFLNYLQTKVKEEWRNMTINGKNNRNARHCSYCIVTVVIVNFGRESNVNSLFHKKSESVAETHIPVTSMHGRKKAKLMGLRLRKYIELREN